MAREDIRLEVLGDIEAYARAVGKIPGVTKAEAEKAGKAFVKATKRAQIRAALEAEKASKEAADDWKAAGLEAAKGFAAGFGAVIGVIATVGAYVDQLAEARLEMSGLSRATGIGLDTLSGIATAAEVAGKEFDDVAGGLEDFGEKMFDASKGSGAALEAFELLGFSQEDLAGRLGDTDGVLREVISGMQGMEEGALKNTVQQQLWGDAGNQLSAVLGDIPLDEFIAKAEVLGKDVTPENVAAAAQWKANLAVLKGEFVSTGNGLAEFLNLSQRFEDFALGFVFLKNAIVATLNETIENVQLQVGGIAALMRGDFQDAGRIFAEAFDVGGAISDVAKEVRENTQAFVDLREIGKKVVDGTKEQTTVLSQLSEEREDAAKVADELAKREAKLASQQVAASEKLRQIQNQLTADTLTDEEAILRARDEQLLKIKEIQDGLVDLMNEGVDVADQVEESLVAANEAVARSERDLDALREANHQEELKRTASEAAADTAAAKKKEAEALKEFEDDRRNRDRAIDAILDVQQIAFGAIDALAERRREDIALELSESEALIGALRSQREELNREAIADRDALNAAILEATRAELEEEGFSAEEVEAQLIARGLLEENLSVEELERQKVELDATLALEDAALQASITAEKKKRRSTRQTALKAFKASKQLALSDVAFQTAAAAIKAWAMFGPPPSPLGIAAAATAVGGGAVQAGLIASQKPPQFHDGLDGSFPQVTGGPDERAATLRTGEGVLNARGAESLGRDNLRDLNATGAIDGGGWKVGLFFDGRMID